MNAVWLRFFTVIVLGLAGLASALLIWFAGSHQYGVISTVWRTTGIGGLIAICAVTYGLGTGVLWSIRRTVNPARVRILAISLAVCALPFVFFLLVLVGRLTHGE
jgi:hypothetical protein